MGALIIMKNKEFEKLCESICDHFALNRSAVTQNDEDYPDEFLITFEGAIAKNSRYYKIEVVDESTKDVNEIDLGDYTYTRLLDSEYYFRWL